MQLSADNIVEEARLWRDTNPQPSDSKSGCQPLAMRMPVCIIDLCFTGNATDFKVYVGKNTDLNGLSLCAGYADACL